MKKSMYVVLGGLFILLTVFLCANTNKQYEKKVEFNSPEEIISILTSVQLGAIDREGNYVLSSDYKECLSKRKRLTGDSLDFYKFEGDLIEDEKALARRDFIKDRYREKLNAIGKSINSQDVEIRTIKGKGYNLGYLMEAFYGSVERDEEAVDVLMDIVFINEGEGYVVDMFWISYIKYEGGEYTEIFDKQ